MVGLSDRLDYLVGGEAVDRLDEVFGIRTVGALLRHYPRSYVDGAAVRGIGDERPAAGQHITLVDTIEHAVAKPMKKQRPDQRPNEYLIVTLGRGRNKVTATFFNAKGLKWKLTKKTRVMLSGEVRFFRGTLQLTHPDFLLLDSPRTKNFGSDSLRGIADASQAVSGEVRQSEFERSCYPIYPASTNLQSWDIFACVRQVLEVLDPVPDPLPEGLRAQHGLLGQDEALRAVHLAETDSERERARQRLTFDEAVGLQWALVDRRHGELSQSGPPAPHRFDGLAAQLVQQLPFELTAGQRDVLDVLAGDIGATRPMNRLLQGEVGSGKTVVAVAAMLQLVDAGYQCALLAPTEVLAAQHACSIRDVLGPLAMAGQLGGSDDATRVALLTGSMSTAAKNRCALRSPTPKPASWSAPTPCCRTRCNFTGWAWWSSTSNTGSVLSSETSCAPRPQTASRRIFW